MSKNKSKIKQEKPAKRGFSLVEMLVVMGIIALLAILGVGTLITLRSSNAPDSAAQDFLSNLRDAQNRSFLVKKDTAGNATKVWTINLPNGGNNYTLESFYSNPGVYTDLNFPATPEKTYDLNPVSVSIEKVFDGVRSSVSAENVYIAYASPFARPYIIFDDYAPTFNSHGCANKGDGSRCFWWQSDRPSEEWELKLGGSDPVVYLSPTFVTSFIDPDDYIIVNFTYNNITRSVVVKANGDAYVQ